MIGTKQIDIFIICLLVALFLGVWCDRTLYWYLKRKDLPKTVVITMMITVVFLFFYGFTFFALRCILLCQVLLVAGVCDRATYEIPNGLHILIAIVGLIHFQLFPALCGFFLVPLPFLIAALKTEKNRRRRCEINGGQWFCSGSNKRDRYDDMGAFNRVLVERCFSQEK